VQVDPTKPMLKAPGTKRLKLNYDNCFQFCFNSAFKFNLRRYNKAVGNDALESILSKNIPINTADEKFNEAIISSVDRIAAILEAGSAPSPFALSLCAVTLC